MSQQFRFSRKSKVVASLVAFLAIAIIAGVALAAGTITISVNPSPPQAIKVGSGTESYNWSVVFNSTPYYYVVHVVRYVNSTTEVLVKCRVFVDPNSFNAANIDNDVQTNLPGCYSGNPAVDYGKTTAVLTSPSLGSDTWSPPVGSTEGIYQVHVDYYSDDTGPNNWESTAATTFWVANGLGTIQLQKFHDVNANGIWDVGELAIPNWSSLRFQTPAVFGSAVYSYTTDALGSTIQEINVPAGTYRTNELMFATGWSQTTPTTTPFNVIVTDGGTGTATYGNTNSTIACSSLAHTAPLSNYITGSQIVYTISWTKTGPDDGAPVATLYFNPAILQWVSDTSGVTPTGSGTSASPYRWALAPTSASSGSFNVTLQFTSDPVDVTLAGVTRVLNGITGSTNCNDSQPFGPTAVTLNNLDAKAETPNNTAALVLAAAVIGVLGLAGLTISRRRTA